MVDIYGKRSMTYKVEGETILSNFDIITEAGGIGKVLVRDFPVTVSDNNGLQIECLGNGEDVFECGLEIISQNLIAVSAAPMSSAMWTDNGRDLQMAHRKGTREVRIRAPWCTPFELRVYAPDGTCVYRAQHEGADSILMLCPIDTSASMKVQTVS